MWTEFLRVKPVLDPADAKKMEVSLSRRFARVAKTFGGGLKAAIKGSILGISLGLLNKLLNPLEALDEKIKNLLGQSAEFTDLADRFNTSPGQLKRLEDVGKSLGVKPEDLKEMLTKFAEGVETARKELENPFQERSATTQRLANFVDEKDLAEGFLKFITSLRAEGKGKGQEIFFGENEQRKAVERKRTGEVLSEEELKGLRDRGLAKHLSGLESRQAIEADVFGAKQHGAARKLIETDFTAQAAQINEPSAQRFNRAFEKNTKLENKRASLEVQNNNTDFFAATAKMNESFIKLLEDSKAREDAMLTKRLESYKDLRKAAEGVDEIKLTLTNISVSVTSLVGAFGDFLKWTREFKASNLWKGFFRSKE